MPARFPDHGAVADVRAWAGLGVQDIGRRIVEWAATVAGSDDVDRTRTSPAAASDAPADLSAQRRTPGRNT